MEDSNMSFDTIYIHRHYPIKNGYVQVPPVLETGKTSVTEQTIQKSICPTSLRP